MFQGAYTDEFYRALHDALHAQVNSWNSGCEHTTGKEQDGNAGPGELWNRVLQLEKSCRNTRHPVAPSFASYQLVQLHIGPA
jgi:hypothetical protein